MVPAGGWACSARAASQTERLESLSIVHEKKSRTGEHPGKRVSTSEESFESAAQQSVTKEGVRPRP